MTDYNVATKIILSRQKRIREEIETGEGEGDRIKHWHKYKSQKKIALMQSESQTLQVLKKIIRSSESIGLELSGEKKPGFGQKEPGN